MTALFTFVGCRTYIGQDYDVAAVLAYVIDISTYVQYEFRLTTKMVLRRKLTSVEDHRYSGCA